VTVQDASGNTVTSATTRITLAIGGDAPGGTLSGTTTVAAVGGVAMFSDLVLDKPGKRYALTADAAGLTGTSSSAFDVTSPPAKLVFAVQPIATVIGNPLRPPVQVAVQDQDGNTVTLASTIVTVAVGTNLVGSILSGTVTAPAVRGVATFSDLNLDKVGAGYTLTAEAAGLSGATSYPFDTIDPVARVVVTPAQSNNDAGSQLTLAATTFDAAGNVVTGRTVSWSTSDWRVLYLLNDLSVSEEVVCGIAPGSVTVTATSEGQSGTAVVTVTGSSSVGCCYAGC
jgi:hypothetical protein